MSGGSKKQVDEKSVFDGSEFGIGHNRGPALDDPEAIVAAEEEADAEANPDTDNRPEKVRKSRKPNRPGPFLSDADIKWLREREKSGELAKVVWDSPYGSESIDAFERRTARGGHSKVEGKHVGGGVLVSRRGYARVIRDTDKAWLNENNIDALRETAARVLHGRNATIFEKHVINPLLGLPKVSVKELAAQFGIKDTRVYKILDKCKERVKRALRGEPPPLRLDRPWKPRVFYEVREYINETAYIDFWTDGEVWTRLPAAQTQHKGYKSDMEKWQSEEQERMGRIRNQIKLQREARDKKGKPDER